MLSRYPFAVFAAACLIVAATARAQWSNENIHMGPAYTVDDTAALVDFLELSPFVSPTASGDADFIVNTTPGSIAGGYPINNSLGEIPALPQFGLHITDTTATGPKTKIAVVSGTHSREPAGTHMLDGFLRKLVDGSSEMNQLLGVAEFYVYPQVNPEGRYAYDLPGNPHDIQRDAPSNPDVDLNRIWGDPADFPQISAIQPIIQTDTGGDVDFFFDFHARSFDTAELAAMNPSEGPKQVWLTPGMETTPFIANLLARDPEMEIQQFTTSPGTVSSKAWAEGAGGLDAEFTYTPEAARDEDPSFYQPIGQAYALALYDTLTESPPASFGTIQIDFNDADTAGAGWQTVDTLGAAVSLVDVLGDPTDVSLIASGDWDATSATTGQDSPALADATLEPGARDYFYIPGEGDDGIITLSGLDPDRTYSIEIVASRSSPGSLSKESDYTVQGLFADFSPNGDDFDVYLTGFNDGVVLIWSSVTPDAQGQITLVIDSATNPQSNGYINALRLTQLTNPVPEPTSAALVLLGGLWLTMRRRRG